ncbi:MAG: peptidoglycan bridge formation glycyltransferase FemA/FemB family protein [Patescibacteria group bacterium]|nr:peptidoglycan bridge formation glycyltransferase FemA/FemB family protein [Patescibacteria group bacterium]
MTKEQWNNFVIQNVARSGAFLQSFEWGKFQESMGRKVIRISNLGQFIKIPLVLWKKYLYCPRGPARKYFDEMNTLAKKEKSVFVRFDLPTENQKWTQPKGIKKVRSGIPPVTLLIDLKKTEDELLKEMHEKTRYNIRLSEKKDLVIKQDSLLNFWNLSESTSKRHGIRNWGRVYYEKLLAIQNFAYVATVYLKGKPLASGIFVDFAGTTTYFFGASSDEHKNLMAPHLLHWHIIKEAKKKGQKSYDFWGINPENSENSAYKKSWEGITRFKKGFGGEIVSYPGTFELPIQKKWYRLYQLAKMISPYG